VSNVLDGYSAGARRVVSLATAEAHQLGHARVGTEHLLLGLLADADSDAAVALRAAGATLAGARFTVTEVVTEVVESTDDEELPYTPRAQRALERAGRFARRYRDPEVDPDHVLLGVLDVEGLACQVMRGLDVDLVRLRESVVATEPEVAPVLETQPEQQVLRANSRVPELMRLGGRQRHNTPGTGRVPVEHVAHLRAPAGTCSSNATAPTRHIPCSTMHRAPSHEGETMRIDKDLVAASATPLVLAILAEGESYGYALLKRVRELSAGELEWTDGMLYPLLHRLGRLGYVTTEWRPSPEGRRRRYCVITDAGRAALAEQHRQWVTVTRALGGALGGTFRLPATFAEA
jgi:DNA-binding PadR family transcriptional regulator